MLTLRQILCDKNHWGVGVVWMPSLKTIASWGRWNPDEWWVFNATQPQTPSLVFLYPAKLTPASITSCLYSGECDAIQAKNHVM